MSTASVTASQRRRLPLLIGAHTRGMADLLENAERTGEQPWARLFAEGHGEHWTAAADYIERHLGTWRRALPRADVITGLRRRGAAREAGHVLDIEFVLDAAARERLTDRFGAEAGPWCDALPGLVDNCCQRWGLELDEALSGGTSRVFIGRQHGGRGVVLKLTPDRSVAETEALALRAWAATPHVVDLLDADTEAGALLLEKVEPGARLADQPGLPSFTEIAGLLVSLRVAGADHRGGLPAQAERVEFLFGLIGRRLSHPQVRPLVSAALAERGQRLAGSLAAGGHTDLVHGDLGLPNVLIAGPERGLVAIDPRPTFGDRTADAIDWAIGRATSAAELEDRIERLCALDPDLDAGRLGQWCQAMAVVIAVQHLYRRPPDATTTFLLGLAAGVKAGRGRQRGRA